MPEHRRSRSPVVPVEPLSYEPTEEELNEPITLPSDVTLDDLEDVGRALVTPVQVVEEAR